MTSSTPAPDVNPAGTAISVEFTITADSADHLNAVLNSLKELTVEGVERLGVKRAAATTDASTTTSVQVIAILKKQRRIKIPVQSLVSTMQDWGLERAVHVVDTASGNLAACRMDKLVAGKLLKELDAAGTRADDKAPAPALTPATSATSEEAPSEVPSRARCAALASTEWSGYCVQTTYIRSTCNSMPNVPPTDNFLPVPELCERVRQGIVAIGAVSKAAVVASANHYSKTEYAVMHDNNLMLWLDVYVKTKAMPTESKLTSFIKTFNEAMPQFKGIRTGNPGPNYFKIMCPDGLQYPWPLVTNRLLPPGLASGLDMSNIKRQQWMQEAYHEEQISRAYKTQDEGVAASAAAACSQLATCRDSTSEEVMTEVTRKMQEHITANSAQMAKLEADAKLLVQKKQKEVMAMQEQLVRENESIAYSTPALLTAKLEADKLTRELQQWHYKVNLKKQEVADVKKSHKQEEAELDGQYEMMNRMREEIPKEERELIAREELLGKRKRQFDAKLKQHKDKCAALVRHNRSTQTDEGDVAEHQAEYVQIVARPWVQCSTDHCAL
jgi:hypothetical protein